MRLGVDVMGGDHAPDAILKGCVQSIPDLGPRDELVLIGDGALIKDYLHDAGIADPRVKIAHTTEVIAMDDPPVEAVKTKKDSSIVKMALLGSHKPAVDEHLRCDAVVSAGNTGACVSAATMHMRRLPGVHRPGIAVTIPTFHGPVVLCDAGANPEPRSSHLAQYALMAEQLSAVIHKKASPRIGVMNIGAEDSKGTDLIQGTHAILKATPGIEYVGYVEGRDVFDSSCDVVVTDGLVGNMLLKTAEGFARSLINGIVREIMEADPDLMLRLEPILKHMFKKNDYHEHGGAPLLGVNGVCMIAHGSSEARSLRAALRQCRTFVRADLNHAITARIGELGEKMESVAVSMSNGG